MRIIPLTLLAGLLAAACGQPAATPTLPGPQVARASHTPAPRRTPAQAPTAAAPQTLTVAAPDGAALSATYYAPVLDPGAGRAPEVVLLPMLGRSRGDWDGLARALQLYGIAALTVDLRGQGQSAGPADWGRGPGDVRAAWEALAARPEVDPAAGALVGASIGANLALIAGANTPAVTTVVALSPGLDYQGVQPGPALANLGPRPVLLVASQDDAYAFDSVRQLADLAPASETYFLAAAGHGTDMLADPALAALILDWLTQKLGVLKG